MTKKQFALIFALWVIVISLIFCTPARSTEIGQVQADGLTCEDSIKDLAAATIRYDQLKMMFEGTKDQHARLVLRTEARALAILKQQITMWRVENCRDA
jgi:hypothetical protein